MDLHKGLVIHTVSLIQKLSKVSCYLTQKNPQFEGTNLFFGICYHQIFSCVGLPNGGIPEDGALSSDLRTGRKSRRQKSSAKMLDAKYQTVSSGKENIELGQVNFKDGLHNDNSKFSRGNCK